MKNKSEKQAPEENKDDSEFERFTDNEEFEDYKINGYHPVLLGETFNSGKYSIV